MFFGYFQFVRDKYWILIPCAVQSLLSSLFRNSEFFPFKSSFPKKSHLAKVLTATKFLPQQFHPKKVSLFCFFDALSPFHSSLKWLQLNLYFMRIIKKIFSMVQPDFTATDQVSICSCIGLGDTFHLKSQQSSVSLFGFDLYPVPITPCNPFFNLPFKEPFSLSNLMNHGAYISEGFPFVLSLYITTFRLSITFL